MISKELFFPTILLPEIYFPFANEKGYLASKIENVAEEGFYKGVEIASVSDFDDRKRMSEAVTSANLIVTQWMTTLITEENLDLSAVDENERLKAVDQIKENIYLATETQASNVAVISGPDPGVAYRSKARKNYIKSLKQLCAFVSEYGMTILLEPLDRNADKRKFLGPTEEAVEIIEEVKKTHRNIGIAFDTAHAALNDEDLLTSLELSWPHMSQLHLSNAVLDKNSKLYGDKHIPIGEPGFLDYEFIVKLFKKIEQLNGLLNKKIRVSVEVRSLTEQESNEIEEKGKLYLKQMIERFHN